MELVIWTRCFHMLYRNTVCEEGEFEEFNREEREEEEDKKAS